MLIAPWELTGVARTALEALRERRHTLGPPDGSVRMDTRSLRAEPDDDERLRWRARQGAREQMQLRSGFVVYRADRMALRRFARFAMRAWTYVPWSTQTMLAGHDGELQVFADFRARVACATRVRAQRGLQAGFASSDEQPDLWWAVEQEIARASTDPLTRAAAVPGGRSRR